MGDLLIEEAAKGAGLAKDEFQKKEVAARLKPITDDDIKQFYEENKERAQGRPIDQLAAPIREYLTGQRQQQARAQLVDDLKKKSSARVMLDPPRQTVTVSADDPVERSGLGADHGRRVLGLSVPVLRARRPDADEAARDLRRQDSHRVQGLPAAESCRGAEGGRGGALRRRAGQVLGHARSAVCESARARPARAQAGGGGARPRRGQVRPVPRLGQVRGGHRRGHEAGREPGRAVDPDRLRQRPAGRRGAAGTSSSRW